VQYINPKWQTVLEKNEIDHYESFWSFYQDQWFEEPNYRRGGWSGVCRAPLILDDVNQVNIFIKRQENHFYRSARHFFLNRPTFEREYTNIRQFEKMGIPTLDLIYFAIKKVNGKYQCILVTKELEGYLSLEALDLSLVEKQKRYAAFESIAYTMRVMHACGYQHGNLYPKHVFVKISENEPVKTCFIDLEKTRRRIFKQAASIKDLDIFYRHLNHVSRTDRLRFFLIYRQEKKLSAASKKMLKTILRKKRK
jgi:tRNA A-37 threonylcarbamoyl transferase component Bud32